MQRDSQWNSPTGGADSVRGESRIVTAFLGLVRHYRSRLLREENLHELVSLEPDRLRARLESIVSRMMREEGITLPPPERYRLVTHLIDEAVGYGPLQRLMSDPSITEIMVNGPKDVWVEQYGRLVKRDDVEFIDTEHVLQLVERVISRLGKRVDESNPWVDARLPNGDRVNAIIPPLSLNGPVLTIRRFRSRPFALYELVTNGTLSSAMADFLVGCIRARLNVLVAGGTGSGKTTLLNAFAAIIPGTERIIVIEDSAELQIHRSHPHVLRLETRPPNVEGKGEVTIRRLVRNALRMRPDRIIVGEVRGAEALDMLQAMNTGHEGSMTTVHANSPREALSRLETMVKWAKGAQDLPLSAIREQLVGALDVIVFLERMVDGSRRVTRMSEVKGVRHGEIVVRDIFVFDVYRHDQEKRIVEGRFAATGVIPARISRIRRYGTEIEDYAFSPDYLLQEFGTAVLQDPQVTEIMVNGPDEVFVERDGRIERMAHVHFRDEAHLRTAINSIVAPLGRRVDEQSPMVDARLPDGSRVNAILPPVALGGPVLTIRRFPQNPLTVDDLIRNGAISEAMVAFLEACVKARLNILISGGTGSGKTTLLNILSGYIGPAERIVTIEDTAELQLGQPHVVRMEARPSDEFGEGEITVRDLVRNALRMRPDRIVVGEVRGAEALDMLQAMNTGHEGSLSTIHANSARDALYRLETLVLWSGVDLPHDVARNQVARAVHVIVQLNRVGGSRIVWQIAEVGDLKHGDYVLSDVARFQQEGVYEKDGLMYARGHHVFVNPHPRCEERFRKRGILFDRSAVAEGAA